MTGHIPRDSPWNDRTKATLRQLFDEGLSTAEIGRRLGVSKNAVIGECHRLHFPARPSPIKAKGSGAPRHVQHVVKPKNTLPPIPAPPIPAPIIVRQLHPVVVRRPAETPAQQFGPVRECCWPMGDPRAKGFRFCEARSIPGKSYCTVHYKVAYVSTREKQENAA